MSMSELRQVAAAVSGSGLVKVVTSGPGRTKAVVREEIRELLGKGVKGEAAMVDRAVMEGAQEGSDESSAKGCSGESWPFYALVDFGQSMRNAFLSHDQRHLQRNN
jgi:hypothetical protein